MGPQEVISATDLPTLALWTGAVFLPGKQVHQGQRDTGPSVLGAACAQAGCLASFGGWATDRARCRHEKRPSPMLLSPIHGQPVLPED